MNKINQFLVISALGVMSLQTPSFASAVKAEKCQIGQTCHLPGNDGGISYYAFTQQQGTQYICDVTSHDGSMKFLVSSGGNYTIDQGAGPYNASPKVTIHLQGHFKNVEDPNDSGEIKFILAPFSATGEVICNKA